MTPSPDLSMFRWIIVNHSGGKDSQAMLGHVLEQCAAQNVSTSRVIVSHQSLGHIEWPGTLELVQSDAAFHGLRLLVTKYRDKTKQEPTLLDYVRKRGKWPDSQNRWCTSEFKRGPGGRVVTALWKEAEGPQLNCLGFRAQESPNRAKRQPYVPNDRYSTGRRLVFDWLPIHGWTLEGVWTELRAAGRPWHFGYDLGMPRLSCIFCIFAPRDALLIAGAANPELLDEYCEVEIQTGHRFRQNLSLVEIRQALRDGEKPKGTDEQWNM